MSCALEGYKGRWAMFTETALTEETGRGIEVVRKTVRHEGGKDKRQ
jgi:hypothetical protein